MKAVFKRVLGIPVEATEFWCSWKTGLGEKPGEGLGLWGWTSNGPINLRPRGTNTCFFKSHWKLEDFFFFYKFIFTYPLENGSGKGITGRSN